MAETVDVVVVGGGIAGASTAYFLAVAGVTNVLVLERGAVAAGASGRASGLLTFLTGSHPVQAAVLKASADFYATWSDHVGGPPAVAPFGALLLLREAQRPLADAEARRMGQAGHDTAVLERQQVAALVPEWDLDDVDLALYSPGSGAIDPPAVTTALMNRARALGVRVYQGAEVIGLHCAGGRVHAVHSTRGEIVAGVVVLAGGAWSAALGQLAGVDLPVAAVRHQVAHLTAPPGLRQPFPLCTDPYLNVYLRPEPGGLITAGYARADAALPPEPSCGPEGFDPGAADWLGPWIRERLARRIPAMAAAQVAGGHAGSYPVTPDHYPLLGPITGVEGLYCLCDGAGNGMTSSPGLAQALAAMITASAAPFDTALLNPSRFATGQLIQPAYHHVGAELAEALESSGLDMPMAAEIGSSDLTR